jgi:hypothetical protein
MNPGSLGVTGRLRLVSFCLSDGGDQLQVRDTGKQQLERSAVPPQLKAKTELLTA